MRLSEWDRQHNALKLTRLRRKDMEQTETASPQLGLNSLFAVHRIGKVSKSADVSECGRYRWSLRRSWMFFGEDGGHRPGKGVCCFVMLNPSTADGTQDDPTIRRCINFAQSWGVRYAQRPQSVCVESDVPEGIVLCGHRHRWRSWRQRIACGDDGRFGCRRMGGPVCRFVAK